MKKAKITGFVFNMDKLFTKLSLVWTLFGIFTFMIINWIVNESPLFIYLKIIVLKTR